MRHSQLLLSLMLLAAMLGACTTPTATPTPAPVNTPDSPVAVPTITPTLPLPEPVVTSVPPTAAPVVTPTLSGGSTDAGATGSIHGWVFHDLCAVAEQGNQLAAGCVRDAFGTVRANGQLEPAEPPIDRVRVTLAQGPCPSIAVLSETTTVVSDLSYSFTNLKPGTYCVAIDPGSAANAPILLPGSWTHPIAANGPLGITVNVNAGENKFNVNFGWDYQFLPEPTVIAPSCVYRAAFLGDVTIPDNTVLQPNVGFIKTWRVRNDGNCAWGPGRGLQTLTFVSGDLFNAPRDVPLLADVPPGGVIDLSVSMVSPARPGLYRSEWLLAVAQGPLVGVGPSGQAPLSIQIRVETPTPPPPACSYRATFLGDVTVPDNSTVSPGVQFVKTWRVRNDSTCAWGPGQRLHQLVWVGGSQLHLSERYEIPAPVQPGGVVDLSVMLVAPTQPGLYLSEWKFRIDDVGVIGVGRDGTTPLFTQFVVGNPGGITIGPDTLFTDVKYVLVNQDAPIYQGTPGSGPVINTMAAGQRLMVTGIHTAGQWWRTLCLDKVGQCWISAQSAVTQQAYVAPGTPIAPNAVETNVRYVRALTQLPIYLGEPGDTSTYGVIWPAGQTAMVTGVSYNGQWYRVVCPDDAVGNCWVSSNPQQVQPTLPGN